jgi:hypothetical protein
MKKRIVLLFWQLYRTRKRGTFALKQYDTFENGMESERFARLAKSKKQVNAKQTTSVSSRRSRMMKMR